MQQQSILVQVLEQSQLTTKQSHFQMRLLLMLEEHSQHLMRQTLAAVMVLLVSVFPTLVISKQMVH